jgi:hypothetical protein
MECTRRWRHGKSVGSGDEMRGRCSLRERSAHVRASPPLPRVLGGGGLSETSPRRRHFATRPTSRTRIGQPGKPGKPGKILFEVLVEKHVSSLGMLATMLGVFLKKGMSPHSIG